MENTLQPVPIEQVYLARERLKNAAIRTPLLQLSGIESPVEIFIKLENLQPVGSFKLRGAANALLHATSDELKDGVWTASAGNMGLGLAWSAQRRGIPCTVIIPEDAPQAKVEALLRLDAQVAAVPFPDYQQIQKTCHHPEMRGRLIHPFADMAVMAGNATIGLEIWEDLPDVSAVLVPYGGGGLSCGIASALRSLRPETRVYACEVETAAPLAASLAAGSSVRTDYSPSFVSGMGAPFVFPQMWPLASVLLHGSLVVSLEQVAGAIRYLAQKCRVIAEGAGAVSLAAALAGKANRSPIAAEKIVCIISGGNIDSNVLIKILEGYVPR